MARQIDFAVGAYYHIFNRGVDKRDIFEDKNDLLYILDNLILFNTDTYTGLSNGTQTRQKAKNTLKNTQDLSTLVDIVAYAFLPNHYHLLLKEKQEGGISKFMHKFSTSYTMYFNEKYERSGALFQGRFKAKDVADLLAVSAYVNLNFVHHGYDTKKDLVRTSYFEYVDPESVHEPICNKEEIKNILDISGGVKRYISDAKSWSKIFVDTHKEDKNFDL